MALIDRPELRRLVDFLSGLPHCSHGCDNQVVYPTPTFRTRALGESIDGQVTEIIARYEQEADGHLRRHLAEHEAARREVAYRSWLSGVRPMLADELTASLLPANMRAAGIRFEWEAR